MQKNFFNCKEIGEAILAAAKSNEQFLAAKNLQKQQSEEEKIENEKEGILNNEKDGKINKENGQELLDDDGGSSSFLQRLHQNSQLISSSNNDNLINKNSNPIEKVFESSQNNEKNQKNNLTKRIIKLKLPKKFIRKIEELFCEENEEKENEKIKEENKGENKTEEENNKNNSYIINELEIPVWLCEMFYKAIHGVSIPNEKQIIGEEVFPTKNQKKKLVATNNNSLNKLSALTTLYEVFPDVPPKTIKHFAKENGYDFELTANCLLNISESFDAKLDLISPEEQYEENQNSFIIIPSKCPGIINPYGAPPKKEEALDLAGTLRQEQLRLTYQNDRLNAWNCPNDCFIDLHGMDWKRAVEFVKYKVDLCRGGFF
uniref:CUE domain-containing protein n=1 Tax=Meloidogyne hapla TaxID=6305 RepID=A0A1I8BEE8_MELHA